MDLDSPVRGTHERGEDFFPGELVQGEHDLRSCSIDAAEDIRQGVVATPGTVGIRSETHMVPSPGSGQGKRGSVGTV